MGDTGIPELGLAEGYDKQAAQERLRRCGSAGLFRHGVPEAFGGLGDRFEDLCRHYERLGSQSRDPGLILAVNAHVWGSIFPLLRFGSDAQQASLLAALVRGDLFGGHAITEPQAGSDTAAMQATARANADGFVLEGGKRYITNAPIADLLVVYAKLDGAISAFLVRRDDPGVEFCDGPTVRGCAGATMGDVLLRACRLPGDRLLGKPGSGSIMIQRALELERAFIFSGLAGIMQWQLYEVVAFAKRRQVKGGPLGDCQAISHRIAEMQLRLETVRLWVKRCAELCDGNRRITVESAATKWYASEAFLNSCLDAVQIFGSFGLAGQHAELVQDAMAGRLFSGSTEIQKNIMAGMLGLGR